MDMSYGYLMELLLALRWYKILLLECIHPGRMISSSLVHTCTSQRMILSMGMNCGHCQLVHKLELISSETRKDIPESPMISQHR